MMDGLRIKPIKPNIASLTYLTTKNKIIKFQIAVSLQTPAGSTQTERDNIPAVTG